MTSLRRGAAGVAAALCLVGCARAGRETLGPAGAAFTRIVDPFPVQDSTGRLLPYAFLGGFDRPRPQLVDIDGDGDLDLFVQEYSGRMMYFENVGTPDSASFVWRTDDYAHLAIGEWSRFVDLDGDGRLDLLAESPYSYLRYYRNVGTSARARFALVDDTVRDVSGQPIFNDRQNIPQIADIDCNGRLDLLLGRLDGTVTRYELAPGTAKTAPTFAFVTDRFQGIQIIGAFSGLHGANTMVVSDIDEDGDPDILWGDFFDPGLLWLKNTGTCGHPVIGRDSVRFPPNAPIRTSGYNAAAVGDLDGDGKLDLLVGVLGGAYSPDRTSRANLYDLRQTSHLVWQLETKTYLPQIDVGSESQPAFVDLNGDGLLDLVIGNKIEPDNPRSAAMYVYTNIGSRTAPAFRFTGRLPIRGGYHYAPAFGDLDGDGRADLILGAYHDALQYYRGAGADSGFILVDSAIVTLTRGSYATPALVDIDGDGDLDLFVGEASGTINFYRNDGTPRAPRFVLVSDAYDGISAGRRSAPTFTDLNGDGLMDLVIGTEEGPLVVYRNVGQRTAPRFVRDTSFRLDLPTLSTPVFVDLTGTGTPALVSGTEGGGVVYLRRGR